MKGLGMDGWPFKILFYFFCSDIYILLIEIDMGIMAPNWIGFWDIARCNGGDLFLLFSGGVGPFKIHIMDDTALGNDKLDVCVALWCCVFTDLNTFCFALMSNLCFPMGGFCQKL